MVHPLKPLARLVRRHREPSEELLGKKRGRRHRSKIVIISGYPGLVSSWGPITAPAPLRSCFVLFCTSSPSDWCILDQPRLCLEQNTCEYSLSSPASTVTVVVLLPPPNYVPRRRCVHSFICTKAAYIRITYTLLRLFLDSRSLFSQLWTSYTVYRH